MASFPVVLLLAVFVAGSGATWVAGVELAKSTDELDRRLGIGDALGGMVLLAITGSLPELAVTVSAAESGHLGLAAGNLIGGIATATMVLVACDLCAARPLTYLVGSLVPVLEGLLVVFTVSIVVMGALLPTSVKLAGRLSPASVAILVVWVGGVWVLNQTRSQPAWPSHAPDRHSVCVRDQVWGALPLRREGASDHMTELRRRASRRAHGQVAVLLVTCTAVFAYSPAIATGATTSSRSRIIAAFSGRDTETTAGFVVPRNTAWTLRWRFDCRGVANPAFAAVAHETGGVIPAMSVVRRGRESAHGNATSTETGAVRFHVLADCPWRLVVVDTAISAVSNPFDESPLTTTLASRTDQVTAALFDVKTGQTWLLRPNLTDQTASIVKVDILETLLWEEHGRTHTDGLDADDQSLATGMIEDSDNDDASDLYAEVGGAVGVARFNATAGVPGIEMESAWGTTMTTALDQVDLLRRIAFPNAILDNAARAYELNLMEHVVGWEDWGISSGRAPGVVVALKNGWVPVASETDWQVNTIGIVDGDGRDYLLAILSSDNASEEYGIDTVGLISTAIWDALGNTSPAASG